MKTGKEKSGLVGAVRSLYEEISNFTNETGEWVEGTRVPLFTAIFDTQGNLIDESFHSFMYTQPASDEYICDYDSEEKVNEQAYYRDGVLQSKVIPSYDEQGRAVEAVVCDSSGTPKFRHVYKYDANGNQTEAAYYEINGSLLNKNVHNNEYDSRGNLIKVTTLSWVTKEGRSFYEPALVRYRTITYY